jgi:hypothetical protein
VFIGEGIPLMARRHRTYDSACILFAFS